MHRRRIITVLLVSLSALTYLDRTCIAVAGPRMQRELGISPSVWGWVLGVFLISYGSLEIPMGALGDRIGHGRVLTRIVLWWSVFTGLTGLALTVPWLLVTRFLFGAGEAGAYPNISGVIARYVPVSNRAGAQGSVWAASRLGGALAPLMIVPMQIAFGWRASFWLLGLLGFAWAGVWVFQTKNVPSADEPSAFSISAGHSIPWRTLTKSRQIWFLTAMYWFYVWGSIFYLSWFPAYLAEGRGIAERDIGRYIALPFLAGIVGNLLGGFSSDRLTQKFGRRVGRSFWGAICLALSAMLLLGATLTAGRDAGIILLTASFGFMDCMLPAAWAMCLDIGQSYAGVVSAAMNSAGQFGGFVCSVAFGYLVQSTGNFELPLLLIAAMVLISSVLFLVIDPNRPIVQQTPQPEVSPVS